MRTDRRADLTKLIVFNRNFGKAPKREISIWGLHSIKFYI